MLEFIIDCKGMSVVDGVAAIPAAGRCDGGVLLDGPLQRAVVRSSWRYSSGRSRLGRVVDRTDPRQAGRGSKRSA